MTWQPAWYFDGLEAIRKLAESGKPFTSDDVHAAIEDPPHYNQTGKLFREAQRLRLIKRTGRSVRSTRPTRRGARIQEWVGAQVETASLFEEVVA